MEPAKTLSMPLDLANEILGYLASRPYSEVCNLINKIREQSSTDQKPVESVEEAAAE